ncbi:MAG: NAD(P)/FAD-dependent oxidoreductase [Bacteroidia bacterium]|nr:NAD(P)/FAD-dependent oxidoreductase [Bacteroidia bacterium]
MKKRVVVIGGGAAGFFSAINLAEKCPELEIILLEKTQKLLAKVKVSGGGRCNVTHDCLEFHKLVKNYPRGEKELKNVFSQFAVKETIEWFYSRGVELKIEEDGRMFPVTNSSQTIIDCLMKEVEKRGIKIWLGCDVKKIAKTETGFELETSGETIATDFVIITCGGFPKWSSYNFIAATGHKIVEPLPSLFTINLNKDPITELMGVSVKEAEVKIAGEKLSYKGPVLITHWGFSGPAVLKLSAFAAKIFHDKEYKADILINWAGADNEDEVRNEIQKCISEKASSLPVNTNIFYFPARLWNYLLLRSEIDLKKSWSEQNRRALNKLINNLFSDVYSMDGKTTFKEEFVTCGGISLDEVNMRTMESKLVPGLFFAGEVLNVDGITGGFNFQAAWSTAYVVAKTISEKPGA